MSFGASREDTPVFAKGRYFHQLILEPEKAKEVKSFDASTRTTKGYKEYCSDNELPFVLLSKELIEIESWADCMLGNLDFFEYEVPAVGEIEGFKWKGKADIVHPDMLIDLKTTGDIDSFKWSARKYNYDSQAYIYGQLFGKPLVFLVIDKTTKRLGMFRPTPDFLERGREKVIRAIEVNSYYISEEL
jgi:hypothetical protein